MAEPMKVRVCPGCEKLHREEDLTVEVRLYSSSIGNYITAFVCDACAAGLAPAPTEKPATRRKKQVME